MFRDDLQKIEDQANSAMSAFVKARDNLLSAVDKAKNFKLRNLNKMVELEKEHSLLADSNTALDSKILSITASVDKINSIIL